MLDQNKINKQVLVVIVVAAQEVATHHVNVQITNQNNMT